MATSTAQPNTAAHMVTARYLKSFPERTPSPRSSLSTGADGSVPEGGLVSDGEGNLYGTTTGGGSGPVGTVFEVSLATNKLTTLATFDRDLTDGAETDTTDGSNPVGRVVLDGQGNLYGMTEGTGSGLGTVFRIALATNTLTTLASFAANTDYPTCLALDGQGNLYGTILAGPSGSNTANGTVFKIALATNALTTLAAFDGSNGRDPIAIALDGQGNLFGTTKFGGPNNNAGTVFKLNLGTNALTTVYAFTGNVQGSYEPEPDARRWRSTARGSSTVRPVTAGFIMLAVCSNSLPSR